MDLDFYEKVVVDYTKELLAIIEPEDSVPCSSKPVTGRYSELLQFSRGPRTLLV